ncbi:MAG TPA: hypothetical protein VGK16_02660 [Candidatus Limnocylindrales bacterium]|jgi:hypothetical protein
MDALKAEQLGTSKWRVLAIPFYGPFKGGKDFDGEFFDRETDIKARWFSHRPVIFHHGMDPALKDLELGDQELDEEPGDDGWWSTVWLNRSNRYWDQVSEWLAQGKAYGSSGAIAHLVRKDHKTGHIDVWPHAEQTITLTPANPYARITASKAVADLTAIAADLRPDLSEPAAAATDGDDVATKREKAIDRIGRLVMATRTIR